MCAFYFCKNFLRCIFIILQIVVIIITGTLFGVNLYGTLMLRQYFDRIWFLPVESMSYKYSTMNTKVQLMSHFVKTRRPISATRPAFLRPREDFKRIKGVIFSRNCGAASVGEYNR